MKTEIIESKKYQVLIGDGEETDCVNCAFLNKNPCLSIDCDEMTRADGSNVYFVEVEE